MENYKYRLEELVTGIEQSVENVNEVIHKQELLIEKLEDDENFKDFVEELKKSIDSEKNQIKILKERHEKITKCIAKLDKKSIIEFLSDLSDGLGLFSKME